MYLSVDLTDKDTIRLSLFSHDEAKEYVVAGRNKDLLLAVDTFLAQDPSTRSGQEEKMSIDDVEGIAVVTGAGSFTSARLSALLANIVRFVRDTVVIAVTKEALSNREQLIKQFSNPNNPRYVVATYSGEANITAPKVRV